jgi:hypothetical protein
MAVCFSTFSGSLINSFNSFLGSSSLKNKDFNQLILPEYESYLNELLDKLQKIENNIKEVRLSTLQKIVELGLGGQLDLSIKL